MRMVVGFLAGITDCVLLFQTGGRMEIKWKKLLLQTGGRMEMLRNGL